MRQPFPWPSKKLYSRKFSSNSAHKKHLERGKKIVESQCAVCHDLTPAKKNSVGPYLFGIVGRVVGTAEEYIYSNEFEKETHHAVWDEEQLDTYLKNLKKFIPGTRMEFIGVKNHQDRADIISYLSTLK
ncbi:MAG: cytochrome c family protein [Candidatus Electrothrix sp. LOE1_4_5]|nr:cytochrome c family protein [Candidatus Electrothrix gigas]